MLRRSLLPSNRRRSGTGDRSCCFRSSRGCLLTTHLRPSLPPKQLDDERAEDGDYEHADEDGEEGDQVVPVMNEVRLLPLSACTSRKSHGGTIDEAGRALGTCDIRCGHMVPPG